LTEPERSEASEGEGTWLRNHKLQNRKEKQNILPESLCVVLDVVENEDICENLVCVEYVLEN